MLPLSDCQVSAFAECLPHTKSSQYDSILFICSTLILSVMCCQRGKHVFLVCFYFLSTFLRSQTFMHVQHDSAWVTVTQFMHEHKQQIVCATERLLIYTFNLPLTQKLTIANRGQGNKVHRQAGLIDVHAT